MKKLISLCVLAFILLTSCGVTPPECVAYCERIEQWAEQCKKPKFSLASCKHHFECGGGNTCVGALRCWQMLLRWAPDMKAEFDCTKTEIPEL